MEDIRVYVYTFGAVVLSELYLGWGHAKCSQILPICGFGRLFRHCTCVGGCHWVVGLGVWSEEVHRLGLALQPYWPGQVFELGSG